MDAESLSEANDEMDNELKRISEPAHLSDISSLQELAGDRAEWGVTIALQAEPDGRYIASGVGIAKERADARKIARLQFIEQLREAWGLKDEGK